MIDEYCKKCGKVITGTFVDDGNCQCEINRIHKKLSDFVKSQKDIDPEFVQIVNDHFFELLP